MAENRYELNKNLAQMLKGGVIMDVTRLRLRIYRLRSRPVSRSTRSMDRMLKILC